MRWFLYNILFTAGFLLLCPYFLYRMQKRGGYRKGFGQRFGRYDAEQLKRFSSGGRIWIHAVSVGEVYVGLSVLRALKRQRPDARFVLSVTTSTGHAIAQRELDEDQVLIYFPVDWPWIMKRVIATIQPSMLVLVEGEYWPNLLRLLHRRGVPMALVNGRVSDSSYRGYRRMKAFTQRLMPMLNPICVQGRQDAERLMDLGAVAEQVHVMGSAKYGVIRRDDAGERTAAETLLQAGLTSEHRLLLGGSTWPGEELILARIARDLLRTHPSLRLILAPRHVERCDEVERTLLEEGFRVTRKSKLDTPVEAGGVFLLDTTGELMNYYAAADLIFVGKSLSQHGGQNPIEPAACERAVLVGPNMENFPAVMEDFAEAQALVQVADEAALATEINRLLGDDPARLELGQRAANLVHSRSQTVEETVGLLVEQLKG